GIVRWHLESCPSRGMDGGARDSGPCGRTDPHRAWLSDDSGDQEAAGVERRSVRSRVRAPSRSDGGRRGCAAQRTGTSGIRSLRLPRRRACVKTTRTAWVVVALLWVIWLLNYLDRQVIFSLFPLIQRELHLTDVELGLIGTAFLWVYAVVSPIAGYLAY